MDIANEDRGNALRDMVSVSPVSLFDDGGLHYGSSADPLAGGTARGHPIWNVDMIDANLNRTGQSWYVNQNGELNDNTLFYGFWKSADQLQSSYYVSDDGTLAFAEANPETFSPFTAGQMDAARKAIGLWDDIAAISFQETTNVSKADITYGNTDTGPASQAYAYLPFGDIYNSYYEPIGFSDINKLGGDVWVNNTIASNFSPLRDSYYATLTLIHETGHALGFSHPGDYNAGDGQELTYGLADYYQDSLQYTVMSYWDAYETGAQHIDWSLDNFVYAATPLVHDISAIQEIYGADMTTRTGDTVYGFNSNADRDAYHFDINTRPVVSIWDAGGTDTLDFSGWNTPSVINLTPGEFSSGGGIVDFLTLEQVNANRVALGFAPRSQATFDFYESLKAELGLTNGLYKDNISIAYGVTIENAIGGGGDDLITGNDAANVLTGNGGDDYLIGGLGNDRLIGGSGSDTFFFASSGTTGRDKIIDFGKTDILVTNKLLNDTNHDGRITFSGNTVTLDTGANADKVALVGISGSSGLRYLGTVGSDSYYGDASVKPTAVSGQRVVEGTTGNDAFATPGNHINKQVYFFDTASAAPLGTDTISQFTTRDVLVTTAKLTDNNNDNIINLGDKFLDFSEDENVSFTGSAKTIHALEFDGQVSRGGVDYFVYSLLGSAAGTADLLF